MTIFDSFAYLDFCTGTVIVQAIVGAVAGVALFGRRLITAVKHKLGLISADEDADIIDVRTTAPKKTDTPKDSESSSANTQKKLTKNKKSAKKSGQK